MRSLAQREIGERKGRGNAEGEGGRKERLPQGLCKVVFTPKSHFRIDIIINNNRATHRLNMENVKGQRKI
jgi:hypothetical protein